MECDNCGESCLKECWKAPELELKYYKKKVKKAIDDFFDKEISLSYCAVFAPVEKKKYPTMETATIKKIRRKLKKKLKELGLSKTRKEPEIPDISPFLGYMLKKKEVGK